MKAITCLLLVLILAPAQLAQTTPLNERPDDLVFNVSPRRKKVTIYTPPTSYPNDSVGRQVREVEREVANSSAIGGAKEGSIVGLQIHVKNFGLKTITSIQGKLLIIDDGREAASLMFVSKEKLRAGKMKLIAKFSLGELTGLLRDKFVVDMEYGYAKAKLRIERVEYADGSVWQHP